MVAIKKALKEGKKVLKNNQIDEREARLLLAFALGINVDELIRHDEMTDENKEKYDELIEKRISGIPYAYITGTKEFMKLNFKVNEDVLIPRPETELLVEETSKIEANSILDMCTGSGCIAISIAYYNKIAKIVAVDKSVKAIEIAKENAENCSSVEEIITKVLRGMG